MLCGREKEELTVKKGVLRISESVKEKLLQKEEKQLNQAKQTIHLSTNQFINLSTSK